MHDVQHGAGSVRSGHWAPTVCQHVLPASPHQRTPVVFLMKDPQGLPISPGNKPNLFLQHGYLLPLHPSSHLALFWLLSKVQVQPVVNTRKSSQVSLSQPGMVAHAHQFKAIVS